MHDEPTDATTTAVRVVVAHDAQIYADGLRAVLSDGSGRIEVVGTTIGLPAPDTPPEQRPDVLLVHPAIVATPGELNALVEAWTDTAVLLLADVDDPGRNIRLLAAGAAGLVDESVGTAAVVDAVLATAHGLGVAPPDYIRLAARRLAAAFPDVSEDLTDEDLELWRDVAEGLDYGAIAERRFVSERTARRHVDALLDRLGVENRFQAAELAGRSFLRDRVRPSESDEA